jgi:dolichyl-phosphate-mannose--protein O-mannosyl transferase
MQRVLLARMATHGGNPMDQTVDTRAWQWFLRPMGYADFTVAGGKPFVTVAYSNPVVWLLVLPAALLGARRALVRGAAAVTGEDQPGERFVLLLFAVCYLPLAAASRPIWLLSSLAVLPFALMLVALESARLARSTRWGRRAVALHAALALAGAVALYPMATGQAKAHAYLAPLVERYRPAFEH